MMTTPQITPDRAGSTVPVACTLTPADLAAQGGRWQRLIARAMIERAETADGLCMSFRPEPGTEEELRSLVAVESECCAWADWTVDTSAGSLTLDVRSADAGIATLHGMFR
jgi:hypothetical protein